MSNQNNTTQPTQNFENLSLFFYDFDVWSAQKSVDRSELLVKGIQEDQLPPSELASLGRKQYIDVKSLRPFTRMQTQARRMVEQYALPVRGGWLLPQSKVDLVYAEFDLIAAEFEAEVDKFMIQYRSLVQQQIDKWPQWRTFIETNAPDESYVRSRFGLEYEDFKIGTGVNDRALTTNSSLGNKLLDEIVNNALTFWTKFCQPERLELAATTVKTVSSWREKVEGLAFISSQNLDPIMTLLDKMMECYERAKNNAGKDAVSGDDFDIAKAVIAILSSSTKLEFYIDNPSYFETVLKTISGNALGADQSGSELFGEDDSEVNLEPVDSKKKINDLKNALSGDLEFEEIEPVETVETEQSYNQSDEDLSAAFEVIETEEVEQSLPDFEPLEGGQNEVDYDDFEVVLDDEESGFSEFVPSDEEVIFDF